MQARKVAKLILAGTASFALALVVTMLVARRSGQSDPRARADSLISRCESKISEIESSLTNIHAAVETPA